MKIEQLKKRYSVKRFDDTKVVSDEEINILKNAMHLCPSSVNIQPWKLFIIKDKGLKEKLSAAGQDTNGKRIIECSHLFVLARRRVDYKHIKRVVGTTEMLKLTIKRMGLSEAKFSLFLWFYSKFNGGRVWAEHQVYIALGFLLAACASLEVGALPMEGIRKRKMDKVLNLSREYKTVVAIAVGYPHQSDATNPSFLNKSRLPIDEIVQEI